MVIYFEVPGEPVAQGRPKFTRIGNHVRAYDPEKSRLYKSLVRDAAAKVMPETPLECAVSLMVMAYRSIPRSWSKKKQESARRGEIMPTTKPDIDNVVKAIKDALTGVIWRDDSKVVSLFAEKSYSVKPRIWVQIYYRKV